MKKRFPILLSPLLRNRYTRMLFAAVLYRRWIAHSEAVVASRQREETLDESYWMGKLRQYAHIVDKGLYRSDVTNGRGVRAYDSARNALARLKSRQALDDPSVAWAASRIRLYQELQASPSRRLADAYVPTLCQYEDLVDAIKSRRCIRSYTDRPVEDEIVDKITDVLDWSPTSCNRQPAKVYATNNPDVVRQCVQLHGGAACFTTIYAPLFLTFCADPRVYEMPVEVALPHVDVALGVENCVLAAHCLGVSLTLLTWALHTDEQDRTLRRILGIPPHLQIIVSAVGGYPSGGVPVPARKNKELFLVKQSAATAG